MTLSSYKELIVWQRSMELVAEVYLISRKLPKAELYGLVSQIQRAAVAIPSNIAEGYRRNHQAEYRQFIAIALGSAAELETQLLIIVQQYPNVDCTRARALLDEVQRMLYTLQSKLGK